MKIRLTIIFLWLSALIHAQVMGSFTDPRDKQVYKTVSYEDPLLGDKFTVMAENLNYDMQGAYVYDNNNKYRKQLGLLYTFNAAINACPPNWHLPSIDEWNRLRDLIEVISSEAGEEFVAFAMKSIKGWGADGNGSNSSGFNALPAGELSFSSFNGLGVYTVWWSSTFLDEAHDFNQVAYETTVLHKFRNLYEYWAKPLYKILSCRCFKD